MSDLESAIRGVAAGVPYVAVPPLNAEPTSPPVVVAWHLMDPPRTEAAFAAALPLEGLDAWRIYLGLPLCGSRLPAGGFDELMQLGYQDAVMKLQGPVAAQAAEEFPGAFAALRAELGFGNGPIGFVGGSMGSAIAQLVLIESGRAAGVAPSAAVLVSPISELRAAVDATGRRYGVGYSWSAASLAVAGRLDFVARADETARAGQPAIRLIVGDDDDHDGFLAPAQRLRAALAERYDDPARVDLVIVSGMGHALADEPGVEPAQQTPAAAAVDRHVVDWLRGHLSA